MKTSCSIIIYNFESLHFLRANIRQIRKLAHPDIHQHIIISEQSSEIARQQVYAEFERDRDITIVPMQAVCSGYSIDYILRAVDINTEFICTMDVDAFPIHKNWLYTSIRLLQEDGFSFVGVHADIENAYAQYGNFYCMAQYFRVGRTETFRLLSKYAGFTRFTYRNKFQNSRFDFKNNDWAQRAEQLKQDGWSDSSVTAHWWEDQYTNHNKFTYAVTDCIGEHGKEPLYGRITDGLVFHFAFSWTSIGSEKQMGTRYADWTRRIKENFDDKLIEEMLAQSKPMIHPIPRQVWNGVLKRIEEPSKELNDKIENLKNE
jgi:hypothetical protein